MKQLNLGTCTAVELQAAFASLAEGKRNFDAQLSCSFCISPSPRCLETPSECPQQRLRPSLASTRLLRYSGRSQLTSPSPRFLRLLFALRTRRASRRAAHSSAADCTEDRDLLCRQASLPACARTRPERFAEGRVRVVGQRSAGVSSGIGGGRVHRMRRAPSRVGFTIKQATYSARCPPSTAPPRPCPLRRRSQSLPSPSWSRPARQHSLETIRKYMDLLLEVLLQAKEAGSGSSSFRSAFPPSSRRSTSQPFPRACRRVSILLPLYRA